MEIIKIAAMFHGVILAIIILFRKENRLANLFISLLILFFSLFIFEEYLMNRGYFNMVFSSFMNIFPLTIGPLFFLYTLHLINPSRKYKMIENLHFVPSFLFFILVFFASITDPKQLSINSIVNFFWLVGLAISGITYVTLTFKKIIKYQNMLPDSFSNIENMRLIWLKNSMLILLIIWSFVIVMLLLNIFGSEKWENVIVWLNLGMAIYIFVFGYFTLWQPEVFGAVPKEIDTKPLDKEITQIINNPKSEEYKSYIDRLESLMNTEKPYLDSGLTRDDLAERLGFPPLLLTEILNKHMQTNFFNYINSFRIEEVKNMLSDKKYENFTILALAFEAGFNSKSTFNSMFKKITGTTPSDFRKKSDD